MLNKFECVLFMKSQRRFFLKVKLKTLILKAFGQVEWKIESTGVGLAEAGSELFTNKLLYQVQKVPFLRKVVNHVNVDNFQSTFHGSSHRTSALSKIKYADTKF